MAQRVDRAGLTVAPELAEFLEAREIEAMDPGEDLHVLVHHGVALGVVAVAKMFDTLDAIHHV